MNNQVSFRDTDNRFWMVLENAYEPMFQLLWYRRIQSQTAISGKIDKDITDSFMIFNQIVCSIEIFQVGNV